MSSTVACIGFTDPAALAALARDKGAPAHELSSTTRWVDSSGAMLLLDRTAQYARPGFDTPVRTPYRGITPLENGLAQVTLTDVSGFELDPFTVVPNNRYTVGWAAVGRVALVAMGVDTEFFATVEDFFDSPRSAMPGVEGEPPAEVKQFGLPWPPPMEIETFLPAASSDSPLATLSGTVQFAEIRTNSVTGHEFLVSRIATVCGEIDLCTPVPLDGVPAPGSVTVGQVELLAGFPAHGLDDPSAAYDSPAERVGPTFRDGDPHSPDDVMPMDAPDLPDGLVLGEDGVVRTTEEHAAWKGGDPEAGLRPKPVPTPSTREETSTEDALDARRELPAEPDVVEPGADEAGESVGNSQSGEPENAAVASADTTDTPEATDTPGAPSRAANQAPTSGAARTDVPGASTETPNQPPASGAATPQTPEATAASASDDDSAPRPGETRREWRARTGR